MFTTLTPSYFCPGSSPAEGGWLSDTWLRDTSRLTCWKGRTIVTNYQMMNGLKQEEFISCSWNLIKKFLFQKFVFKCKILVFIFMNYTLNSVKSLLFPVNSFSSHPFSTKNDFALVQIKNRRISTPLTCKISRNLSWREHYVASDLLTDWNMMWHFTQNAILCYLKSCVQRCVSHTHTRVHRPCKHTRIWCTSTSSLNHFWNTSFFV